MNQVIRSKRLKKKNKINCFVSLVLLYFLLFCFSVFTCYYQTAITKCYYQCCYCYQMLLPNVITQCYYYCLKQTTHTYRYWKFEQSQSNIFVALRHRFLFHHECFFCSLLVIFQPTTPGGVREKIFLFSRFILGEDILFCSFLFFSPSRFRVRYF